MPIVESHPQGTTAIAAGWLNPTNAYRFNATFTNTVTDNAEQEYEGYRLGLQGTERIDKVFARIRYYTRVVTAAAGDAATFVCYLRVYNGATWQNYQVATENYDCTTANDEDLDFVSGESTDQIVAIDVTAFLNTIAKINSAKTRLLFDITATAAGITVSWYVDCVSLLVCYSPSASVMVTAPSRPSYKAQKSLTALKQALQLSKR